MFIIYFQERTNKMRLIYADYNPQTNSIDVTTFENYILRIDCNKAEDGLREPLLAHRIRLMRWQSMSHLNMLDLL